PFLRRAVAVAQHPDHGVLQRVHRVLAVAQAGFGKAEGARGDAVEEALEGLGIGGRPDGRHVGRGGGIGRHAVQHSLPGAAAMCLHAALHPPASNGIGIDSARRGPRLTAAVAAASRAVMIGTGSSGESTRGRWIRGAVHLHAGGDCRACDHFARAGDPAHAADVGFQLHPRHRADRRDGSAGTRRHHAGKGDRIRRRGDGRRQRRRWLRRHRAHAGDVQAQRKSQGRRQEGRRMSSQEILLLVIKASYLAAATLFLLGMQRIASPRTARSGIQWAGVGMVLATLVTFFIPGLQNVALIVVALLLGTVLAWVSGKKVAITDMPQMVAMYNGLGGGSAAAIGAVELLRWTDAGQAPGVVVPVLAVLGALIGSVALTGSIIAWGKLDGRMDKRYSFPGMQLFNAAVFVAALVLGGMLVHSL